ncbi:hypothetical protein PCE1_001624 [Barthelona sp. PCE]
MFADKDLKPLEGHSFEDQSIMRKYIFLRFFKFLARVIAKVKFISPNLITFSSLAAIITSIVLLFLNPSLTGVNTKGAWLIFGSWTLFMIADNVDGEYARLTGMCSPLGGALDHMVDSLMYLYAGSAISLVLGCGRSATMILILLLCTAVASHAVQLLYFFTHHLHMGKVNASTEGIVIIIVICLLRAIIGPFEQHKAALGLYIFAPFIVLPAIESLIRLFIAKHEKTKMYRLGQLMPFLIVMACSIYFFYEGAFNYYMCSDHYTCERDTLKYFPVLAVLTYGQILCFLTERVVICSVCQYDLRQFSIPSVIMAIIPAVCMYFKLPRSQMIIVLAIETVIGFLVLFIQFFGYVFSMARVLGYPVIATFQPKEVQPLI